jgi:hypothetical protein
MLGWLSMEEIKKTAERWHVYITLVISVAALFAAVGVTVNPPWPSKSELSGINTKLDTMLKSQQDSLDKTNILMMDYWRTRKRSAEAELQRNPDSPTAAEQLDQANQELRKLGYFNRRSAADGL